MPSPIPSWKLIPGTDFSVDAFRYPLDRVKAYFLTHAHSDHYTGLSEKWTQGPIYCTEVTGRLVCHITGVHSKFINVLPMNTEVTIHGVKVTAVDANHCPGAAMLLFEVPSGERYVHVGDFRGCASMQQCPHLQRFVACEGVFLDTTYCHPKHVFPAQRVSVEEVGRLCEEYMKEDPPRLIMLSSYTIGKEKIFMEIARRCKVPICVTQAKMDVMKLLPWPADLPLEKLFTTDPHSTRVHVVAWNWLGETWPYFRPNYCNMEIQAELHGFKGAVGFVPTGWTFQTKGDSFPVHEKPPWKVHLIPYSEHSSFHDLQEFVKFLGPQHIIPTVGVSGEKGDTSTRKMLAHFTHLCDQSGAKRAFLGPLRAAADKVQSSTACDGPSDCDRAVANVNTPASKGEGPSCDEPARAAIDNKLSLQQEGECQLQHATEPSRCAVPEGDDAACCNTAMESPADDTGKLKPAAEASSQCEAVGTLMAVIREGISEADALKLLKLCGNSIERAANRFYDQQQQQQQHAPAVSSLHNTPPSKATEASRQHHTHKSPAASTSKLGNKRALPAAQKKSSPAKPSSKAQKKDAVAQSANQKSIMAFMHSPKQLSSSITLPTAGKKTEGVQEKGTNMLSMAKIGRQSSLSPMRHLPAGTDQGKGKQAEGQSLVDMTSDCEGEKGACSSGRMLGEKDREAMQRDNHPIETEKEGAAQQERAADLAIVEREPASESTPGVLAVSDAAGQMHGSNSQVDIERSIASQQLPQADDAPGSNRTHLEQHVENQDKLNSQVVHSDVGVKEGIVDLSGGQQDKLKNEDSRKLQPATIGKDCGQKGAASGTLEEASVLLPLERYCPQKHACWPSGPVPYMHIAAAFAAMDSTTKRLRIGDALTNMFRAVMLLTPDDLEATAYLTVGKLAPDYEGVELQVGGATVASAVVDCTGVSSKRLSEMYVALGDLGDVAEKCKSNQRTLLPHPHLTVRGVFAKLHDIAAAKGTRSAQRKQSIIAGLLRAGRGPEVKYCVRTLVKNLRVGANWRSVVRAMGCAAAIHTAQNQQAKFPTKQELATAADAAVEAFHSCPSLSKIVHALKRGGVAELGTLGAAIGVPVKPMLAKITAGVEDCVKQTTGKPVLVEYKYDGQRAQIHVSESGEVKIYSRNCEDKTAMFPDVCASILAACRHSETPSSFIVDSELVAVDRADNNRLRAFQDLSTRAREGVNENDVSVHVCIFLFDILLLQGDILLRKAFRERRRALSGVFTALKPGHVALAQSYELHVCAQEAESQTQEAPPELGVNGAPITEVKIMTVAEARPEIEATLLGAIAGGGEGLMLKFLDTRCAYEPSKRADSWLKLKKDYCEGLRDSLDLVPVGAWHGNGRKAGWYSPFLLACWDPEREEFQSVCRVMSGFSDVFYKAAKERYDKQHVLPCKLSYVNTSETPDVWFTPTEVWEIRGADLTLSPVHKAAVGLLHPERGCSLRFPRFIKVREDKNPEDASGPDYIRDLFNAQTRKSDHLPIAEAAN